MPDLAGDIRRAIEHLAGVGAGAVVGVAFGLPPTDQPGAGPDTCPLAIQRLGRVAAPGGTERRSHGSGYDRRAGLIDEAHRVLAIAGSILERDAHCACATGEGPRAQSACRSPLAGLHRIVRKPDDRRGLNRVAGRFQDGELGG